MRKKNYQRAGKQCAQHFHICSRFSFEVHLNGLRKKSILLESYSIVLLRFVKEALTQLRTFLKMSNGSQENARYSEVPILLRLKKSGHFFLINWVLLCVQWVSGCWRQKKKQMIFLKWIFRALIWEMLFFFHLKTIFNFFFLSWYTYYKHSLLTAYSNCDLQKTVGGSVIRTGYHNWLYFLFLSVLHSLVFQAENIRCHVCETHLILRVVAPVAESTLIFTNS